MRTWSLQATIEVGDLTDFLSGMLAWKRHRTLLGLDDRRHKEMSTNERRYTPLSNNRNKKNSSC